MLLSQDLFRQVCKLGRKASIGAQHHPDGIGIRIFLGVCTMGSINMIPIHGGDFADLRLQFEVGLEDLGIFGTGRQQHVDGLIRHLIAEVAGCDGRSKPPEFDVLGLPVVHECSIHLSEQVPLG